MHLALAQSSYAPQFKMESVHQHLAHPASPLALFSKCQKVHIVPDGDFNSLSKCIRNVFEMML